MAGSDLPLTLVVSREGAFFNAVCAENDVASSGSTLAEAVENVTEALLLWYEDDPAVSRVICTVVGNALITADVPHSAA